MKKIKASLFLMVAVAALNAGAVQAGQPHMKSALDHLRAARAELQSAEHNKGGWRLRALANVDRAIADTEAGMKSAR
jgi:hypothetical protein